MFVFIFVLMTIFVIINFLFAKSQFYYQGCEQFCKFKDLNDNKEILAFGSGPGVYDINFNKDDNTKVNLCVWPEDFRYDFRMLKFIDDKIASNAVIIHIISPLSFAKNVYVFDKGYNERYLAILHKGDVDLSGMDKFISIYLPIINHPKRFIKWILRKNVTIIENCLEEEEMELNEKEKYADRLMNGWLETNPGLLDFEDTEQLADFKGAFERNINDLMKIKKYCMEHEYQYYPVIAPMSGYMKNNFGKYFLEKVLYENIKKSGIKDECIDYLKDSRFDNIDLYLNGLFLNKQGREMLTKDLLAKINEDNKQSLGE